MDRSTSPGGAPRLSPDQLIGSVITRRGIFADRDPLRPGRLWTRWQWLGLLFWGGLLGGSVAKAYRDVGGLPGRAEPTGDTDLGTT